jgi:DNA-directed RNA polymerase subunit beta'
VLRKKEDITQGLTRVEELFEARPPKSPALLAEIDGQAKMKQKDKKMYISVTSSEPLEIAYDLSEEMIPAVKVGDKVKPKMIIARSETQKGTLKATDDAKVTKIEGTRIITKTEDKVTKTYKVEGKKSILVKNGEEVTRGQQLASGHTNLKELLQLTNEYRVQKYLVTEVQKIYSSQGQSINDKHVELIAKQMLSKVRIFESGDSDFLPGEIIDIINFRNTNKELKKNKKKEATGERLLLGLTRIALYTNSWLSAASFQETIRVLVEASTTNRIDDLEGLKENVIIGKLIPAGEIYRKKYPEIVEQVPKRTDVEVEDEEEPKKHLPVI